MVFEDDQFSSKAIMERRRKGTGILKTFKAIKTIILITGLSFVFLIRSHPRRSAAKTLGIMVAKLVAKVANWPSWFLHLSRVESSWCPHGHVANLIFLSIVPPLP